MATRTCVTCGLTETADHFSRRQWRKGVGRSRCYSCVQELEESYVDDAAVRDANLEAHFSDDALEQPFEAGGFRWVALGHYTSGDREGEPCVAKWLIEENAYDASDYRGDMRCVHRTLDFVRAFNALGIVDIPIRVHVPSTHRFEADSALPHVVYLREPFIEGYDKWNSNSGWVNEESVFADAMQALSHYSYHASGGQHVLCDLQGGLYENEAVLSDPAILSVAMDYGSTDMGAEGILTFFHQHTCNQFCDENWSTPYSTGQYIESEMNTVVWDPNREEHLVEQDGDGHDHEHEHEHYDHDHHHQHDHQYGNELEHNSEEMESEGDRSEVSDYEEDANEYYDSDEGVSETQSDRSVSSIASRSSVSSSSASESVVSESQVSFHSYRYESERESQVNA